MRMRLDEAGVTIIVSGLVMVVALCFVFVVAPQEATMGDVQRIFYLHVAASWCGYLALVVAFRASVACLRGGSGRWDALALASSEIGWVFITGGIVTGSIWARATWGTWWTWDPRLTTSAVLWLCYVAYLILRHAIEEPGRRARVAAAYNVAAFVMVPLNFMAIRWWRAAHPLVWDASGLRLAPPMIATLVMCVIAFTALFVVLLRQRLRLERMRDAVARLAHH